MTDYKCTQGHDLCYTMLPGPECPYCERKPRIRDKKKLIEDLERLKKRYSKTLKYLAEH